MTNLDQPILSRVPEAFLKDATDIERHLVHKLDVVEQQNQLGISALKEVREQTTLTNGRVNALERRANEADELLGTVKNARSRFAWLMGVVGSFIGGAVIVLVDKLFSRWLGMVLACGLLGCSAKVPATYTKPSVVSVAQPVAEARAAIGQTRKAVADASNSVSTAAAGVLRAAELARLFAERGVSAGAAETVQLQAEVESLQVNLSRVTMVLRAADEKAALAEDNSAQAETRIGELDQVIDRQTVLLNDTVVDLSKAQTGLRTAELARDEAVSAKHALQWKVGLCLAAVGLLIGAGLYFKFLRFGL